MTKGKRTAWFVAAVGAVGAVVAGIFLWPTDAAAEGARTMRVAEVQALLRRVFAGSSIPMWFAFAVAQLESGFGQANLGDRGNSVGIFHLYWPAQRATALLHGITTKEQLADPEVNAIFWRDHVASVFARAVGASASDPASWERVRLRLAGAGGRDGTPDNASDEARLRRYRPVAAKWLAELEG